ncbi:hypothetical protein ACVXG7_08940 [Enterobacter hormaechei]
MLKDWSERPPLDEAMGPFSDSCWPCRKPPSVTFCAADAAGAGQRLRLRPAHSGAGGAKPGGAGARDA